MNASQIFNSAAKRTNSNFSQSGNYVRSTQPGKPFASTEALNYIPVGYNKSGGDLFRYGALSTYVVNTMLKKTGQKNLSAGQKGYISGALQQGVSFDDIAEQLKAGANIKSSQGAHKKLRNVRERTQSGIGGSTESRSKETMDIKRKRDNLQLEINKKRGNLQGVPADLAQEQATARKGYRARKKEHKKSSEASLHRHVQNRVKPKSNQSVHKKALDDIKADHNSKMSKIGDQNSKLGQSSFAGASKWFKGLSGNAQIGIGVGGGIAALTATGMAVNQISGSKNNPLGSGLVTAGMIGAGAGGLKMGASAMLKKGLVKAPRLKAVKKGGKVIHSPGNFHRSMKSMAGMKGKDIATMAAVGGVGMAGLGMSRNVMGV